MHFSEGRVEYGMAKNVLAFVGVVGGVGIAIGLPAVMLIFGAGLPTWLYATVFILSLLVGGTVAGISAFFGIVVPKSAGFCVRDECHDRESSRWSRLSRGKTRTFP